MRWCWVTGVAFAASLLVSGCGAHVQSLAPDSPVPRTEPRAELVVHLDLAQAQDCEEKFDIALYQERAVELIEWDIQKGVCTNRTAHIRYLSSRLTAKQLQAQVELLAKRVTVLSGK